MSFLIKSYLFFFEHKNKPTRKPLEKTLESRDQIEELNSKSLTADYFFAINNK